MQDAMILNQVTHVHIYNQTYCSACPILGQSASKYSPMWLHVNNSTYCSKVNARTESYHWYIIYEISLNIHTCHGHMLKCPLYIVPEEQSERSLAWLSRGMYSVYQSIKWDPTVLPSIVSLHFAWTKPRTVWEKGSEPWPNHSPRACLNLSLCENLKTFKNNFPHFYSGQTETHSFLFSYCLHIPIEVQYIAFNIHPQLW